MTPDATLYNPAILETIYNADMSSAWSATVARAECAGILLDNIAGTPYVARVYHYEALMSDDCYG